MRRLLKPKPVALNMVDEVTGLAGLKTKTLSWWIARLFMIGSVFFGLGCVLFLGAFSHEFTLDAVFFVGSMFFTAAAFCQFYQSRKANEIVYWSAFAQFVGTLLFNMNTFDAFFDLGLLEQELLVWVPNIFGSILFQVSASLAMLGICKKWWCWRLYDAEWRVGLVNYLGCVAFLISAGLAFVTGLANWATIFTLIGAICFFVAALMSQPKAD